MKNIFLTVIILLQITACSQPNKSEPPKSENIENPEVIDLGELNVSPIDGQIPSGNLDFGNVLFKEKVIQSLVITNQSTTPFNISLNDTVLESSDFIIEKNTCVAPLQRRRNCTITVAITNNNQTSSDINASGNLIVKGVPYSLSALLKVNEDNVGEPIAGISVQPTFLNFGNVNPGETKDLTIRVTNLTLPSISIPVTSSSNANVSLVRNSCLNRQLLRRRSCFISYRYTSPNATVKFTNANLSFIANNKITFSGETSLASLTNPNFLSIVPSVPSFFESMSQPQIVNRTVEFINQGNVVLPSPINVVTSSDGIEVVSHTCSSGLRPGTKCSVNFNINSLKLEKGSQTYLLRLQSSSLASANLTIFTDISNNNYSLSVNYADLQLAMQVSQLKIYKNNILCASACLESYSPGDIAKIEVISTTAVGVDDFIVDGAYSNLEKPISRIVQFTFGAGDVDVEIILGVGPVQSPPIDPTPTPVPNPISGGVASVRCYNKSGLDRLSASLKLEKPSEIPSLIYSGITPKEADDLVVDAAENPTFHGWAFYQGEVHQCYNFSVEQSIPTPQTCQERLAAWGKIL